MVTLPAVTSRVTMMGVVVVVVAVTGGWWRGCGAEKSIVWVHGIFSDAAEFDPMKAWIQRDFPNASTHSLTCSPDLFSLEALWGQLPCFSSQLTTVMETSPQGVVLICFSQGGVICRGLLSTLRHNVDTFIALSSPLAGQFGDTNYLKPFFHDIVKEEAYLFFYSKVGQDTSVGNYWNDPHQRDLYLKENVYLTRINNDVTHSRSAEFKANFLRLKKLILIGGPQDEIIGPWQSSHFGFYDSNEVVQPMTNISWYAKDSFGLRTLDKSGRIHTYVVPDVRHTHWPQTLSVYQCCVRPWLG